MMAGGWWCWDAIQVTFQAVRDLGAVSSGHSETSAAGTAILEAGGTAVDAIVAAALAAGVCEPLLTGMGGGGLMTVRLADGEVTVVDCFS